MDLQTLLDDLKESQQNGTPEEQDHIFLKLKDKAAQIEHQHLTKGVSPEMQRIYTAITHKVLPTSTPSQELSDVTDDKPSPKVIVLIRQMGQLDFESTPEDHIARWDTISQRGKKLKKCTEGICKDCHKQVLPELFVHTAKVGVRELKKEKDRLRQMKHKGMVTDYRLNLIVQELEHTIDDMMNLVMDYMKRFEKGQKVDWTSGVEELILSWTRLYNHCLNQYVNAMQDRQEAQY